MTATLIIALLAAGLSPSDTLLLRTAYDAARENFAAERQAELYADITSLRIDNINAQRRLQLSASAQALYQSDVPKLPIEMPGFAPPDVSKDQYKAALNVEQLIYDGGRTSVQRDLERATGALSAGEVRITLHERLDRITEAYFSALLQDVTAAALASHRESLKARREAVHAQIDQGILSATASDVLGVELLRLEQQIEEARAERLAAVAALEVLSGVEVSDELLLALPELPASEPAPLSAASRPEYRVFELQKERLEQQQRLAAVQRMPRVAGFGTAAYGRPPGMNIFENELRPYFSAGIQVQWRVWDWGSSRREQEIAQLRQEVVETQEEAFSEGVRAAALQIRKEIDRLHAALERDREIIQLRDRLAARAAEQLDNGTVSATDYLLERQAAHRARLDRDRHQIELGFAQVRYLGILGRYDEIR